MKSNQSNTMLRSHRSLFVLFIIYAVVLTCNAFRARIVNGYQAQLGEIPYQVSFQVLNVSICGGSILDEYHVLTAAHCIVKYKPGFFSVVVGTVNLESKTNPGIRHKVNEAIVHEKFVWKGGWPNDIALLRLEKPIAFNKYVQPAKLPKSGEKLKKSQPALISGFGRPNLKSPGSPLLMKTDVFIEDNDKCQSYYHVDPIKSTHICTRPTRVTGTCEGDSGGPITVDGKVVGIASFSLDDGCAGPSMRPQAHTRVSEYIDWINSHRN